MTKMLILSHSTARLIHRLPRDALKPELLHKGIAAIRGSAPSKNDLAAIRTKLMTRGLDEESVSTLEFTVTEPNNCRNLNGARVHLHGKPIPISDLVYLGDGLYVVDIRLCALQAACQMDLEELVEYYYEICSDYALPLVDDDSYQTRPPLTSVQLLREYFSRQKHEHGLRLARRAVRFTRDGARSPMETALALLFVLPKSCGGLSIRDIELNYFVRVSDAARKVTRRAYFYFDIYIKRARLDVEYNGRIHESEDAEPIDEERKNALDAMGYQLVTFRRQSLFDAEAFKRIMVSVRRRAGIGPAHLPEDFDKRQEQLRKFVLRRWLSSEDDSPNENAGCISDESDPYIDEIPTDEMDINQELPPEWEDFDDIPPEDRSNDNAPEQPDGKPNEDGPGYEWE
ncbi:hypothetical protein [Collinsella tanakaei]|uniref:hypothetical protein n=1 Tax=Collinsella tanakaei TaxID=626935 RepID=UPI0025A4C892|nr:hypothetical protein [Collinsella tanakaei]MDM8299590.1 hypothetical protein [Collinsella tanakaei]